MANNAAIAGATGLVGSHLLPLLLREFNQVVALTRRPLGVSARNLRELGLSDLLEAPLEAAFCCLGTTIRKAGSQEAFRKVDFDAIVDFARRAKLAGTRQFALVSSVGADASSSNFYLRVKGETEQAIRELGFASAYFLRPSFLVGDRGAERRSGEGIATAVTKAVAPILVGPLARYRAIEASTVARAMLELTRQAKPGAHVIEYKEMIRLCQS